MQGIVKLVPIKGCRDGINSDQDYERKEKSNEKRTVNRMIRYKKFPIYTT